MRTGIFLRARYTRFFLAGPFALAIVGGCALQHYEAVPLDPAASARAFESRSIDAPGLKDYMASHGSPAAEWPVQRWGLPELTLLAFYYQPGLDLARSEAKAVHAEGVSANQRWPIGFTPRVEHHSRELPDTSSPWSLGFAVEIPLTGTTRRQAIAERYGFLETAAELKVGSVAWAVRSEVRARLLDYYAADRAALLLDAELRERNALAALLERRLEAGAVSAVEVNNARLKLVELEGQVQAAPLARERSIGALAQALGLPLSAARSMTFAFDAFEQTPTPPGDLDVRRAALLNRLDIRAKLLDYSAADAAVKLEVARQYPTLVISPGYLWDQGDSVWSLAATALLPAGGNKPAIQAAEARRDVAAKDFLALQSRTISVADGAQAEYQKAIEDAGNSQRVLKLYAARSQDAKKQFDAGYADRVELTLARIEALVAQRSDLAVGIEAQKALGALEDALEVPLAGGPVPAWTQRSGAPSGVVQK